MGGRASEETYLTLEATSVFHANQTTVCDRPFQLIQEKVDWPGLRQL